MNAVGYFTRKIRVVDEKFAPALTRFVMDITLPCLIFNSVTSAEFSLELLRSCGVVLVLSAVVCLISLGLGQIVYIRKKRSGEGRIFRYGMVFPHYSFMGIPVMSALFGAQGELYYVVFLIPVRILYYGTMKQLLLPEDRKAAPESEHQGIGAKIRQALVTPTMITMIIALVFWIGGWHLPEVITTCISNISALCSPLGLLICGMTLAEYNLKELLNVRFLKLPLIRGILMPAIFFVLTRLLLLTGIDSMICDMIVIYSALPIASMTAAFTVQYDPDKNTQFIAAGSVFFSVLLSMITLPIWYMLL